MSNYTKTKDVRTLGQKIREYFKLEYDYWWNDFKGIKYYEDFGIAPPTFREKCRHLKLKLSDTYRYRKWLFKESFKWHVKCYLNFWRLPKLLQAAMDGYVASESYRDLNWESKDVLAEPFMKEIVDTLYFIRLKDRNYEDISAKEKEELRTEIKEKYEFYGLRCPNEFLTVREIDRREEDDYENSRLSLPGGPDYDERPSLINRAESLLKKYKFNSRYSYYQKYRGDDE